jgi:hypothetical protein
MALITQKPELSLAEVLELMEDFTYKPNWSFQVSTWDHEVRITLEMWVPDSTRPFRPVQVQTDQADWWALNDHVMSRRDYIEHQEVVRINAGVRVPRLRHNEFYTWLRGVIRNMEDHELDEWFKVNGVPVNDPHAK